MPPGRVQTSCPCSRFFSSRFENNSLIATGDTSDADNGMGQALGRRSAKAYCSIVHVQIKALDTERFSASVAQATLTRA